VPVIRTPGPLEGVVSRAELVEVQNAQLDGFHLKEQLDKMAREVDAGKIIGSMHLDNNIHAQAFKHLFTNPVAAVREVLDADDAPLQVADTFYLQPDEARAAAKGAPAAAAANGLGPSGKGLDAGAGPSLHSGEEAWAAHEPEPGAPRPGAAHAAALGGAGEDERTPLTQGPPSSGVS
jgi:chloride channel 7